MSTNPELLLPVIRDRDGTELSADETLSRWLLTGKAAELPPAYDDSGLPVPETFGDPDIAFLGPGDAGRRAWERNRLLMLLNDLDRDAQVLLCRHIINGRTFTQIAGDSGVSRQAVQQRYGRLCARLREQADSLPALTSADLDEFEIRAFDAEFVQCGVDTEAVVVGAEGSAVSEKDHAIG